MPRPDTDEQELIHILQNSRLGKIRYHTGLDPKEAQREAEKTQELMSRAISVTKQTAMRERRIQEESLLQAKVLKGTELGQFLEASLLAQRTASPQTPLTPPTSTSNSSLIPVASENSSFSLGDSIMSLNTTSPMIPPKLLLKELNRSRNTSETNATTCSLSFSTPPRRKGFGIRNDPEDGEYDDTADAIALATQSPIYVIVRRQREELEQQQKANFEEAIRAKQEEWLQFKKAQELEMQKLELKFQKEVETKQQAIALKWKNRKLAQERRVREKRKEHELYNQMKDKDLISQKQLETERKKIEQEIKEAEEKLARIEKQNLAEAEAAKAKFEMVQQAEKAKLEEEEKLRQIAAEKLSSAEDQSPLTDTRVHAGLRGSVFHSDLARYVASQDLLEDIRARTAHISGSTPQTKMFYLDGIKAVNQPLNQIGEQDLQSKITHFINLLDGKSVQWGSMNTSFVSSAETDGHLFIMNIFAFRFVKKAEAEVSENKVKNGNLNYLAKLGVTLIKRFPVLGKIIQAHFYKLCPFLVPFSYPRGGMSIEEYAAAVGHEINFHGAREETVIQVLLAKLNGYCALYGFMVKNFEADPPRTSSPDLQDMCSFLSSGEVWSILRKTTMIEPQIEVTATMVHGLLEIMSDCLGRRYLSQFRKCMLYIKTHFIPKLRQSTPSGKGGSLARLELFIEKNVR